jgi:hypothetical protein
MDGRADHPARAARTLRRDNTGRPGNSCAPAARGLGRPSLDGRSRNPPVAPIERGLPWKEFRWARALMVRRAALG